MRVMSLSKIFSELGWSLAQIDIMVKTNKITLIRKNGKTAYLVK